MYKLTENELVEAPNPIIINNVTISNPTRLILIADGWKDLVIEEVPETTQYQYLTFAYTDNDTEIVKSWTVNDKTIINDEIPDLPSDDYMYQDYEHIGEYEVHIGKEVVMTPEAIERYLEEQERQRLDSLFLTKADVERAIYADKGIDFSDIITQLQASGIVGLDIKRLKIEFGANNFYRGNDYVKQIGQFLGYTTQQLDYLFQTKTFPIENEEEVVNA